MLAKHLLSLNALLCLVGAQTAPGFPISSSSSLTLTYGNNTVSPPGELIPRGDTAQPPTISSMVWRADERGAVPAVVMMVDSDVPRNGTRVQLLHWLATNVTQPSSGGLLSVGSSFAPYLQPSPPVGDIPHSYTFVVFAQPRNFSIPARYADLAQNRVGFNTSEFLRNVGLGESDVIGANYVRVQNLTGTPATTFPPPRATSSGASNTSSTVPFPGGAAPLIVGSAALWAGISTALLAGVAAVVL